MKIKQPYTIKKVQEDDMNQIVEFMMRIRKEVFPMLSPDQIPPDLIYFDQHYIKRENSAVYAAFLEDGTVLGTIGICLYDGRFNELQHLYQQISTAEIVKCYIDSKYRRLGIGTLLFHKALRFCDDVGYQKLYLHTHPFLPGAIPFWRAKGFEVRLAEDDPVWNTVHMDREI